MALVSPFQAVRFNPSLDLSKHVTQPYDKIPPALHADYRNRSPHNIVNLILPDERKTTDPGVSKYQHAARLFSEWNSQDVLVRDPVPGLYPYRQAYELNGTAFTRAGFIGLCNVEDYAARIVFPHERTLSNPKADRYALLDAGRVHYGLIFLLYEDDGTIQACLDACMQTPASASVNDDFSVLNELWQLSDPNIVRHMTDAMADKQVFIADGHHRYETSLMYARNHPDDPRAQYTMAMFVNINSQLEILPTHRSVRGISEATRELFPSRLRQCFDVRACSSLADVQAALQKPSPTVRLGGYDGSAWWTAELRGDDAMRAAAPDMSVDWRALDVAVLHTLVLENVLGISQDMVAGGEYVSYHRDPVEAVSRVSAGADQFAFFLQPTKPSQLCAVARNGEVMPQKSTDFYPKLLTGLTMYAMDA